MRTTLLTTIAALLVSAPLSAQDPYEQSDDTWITMDGTVEAVTPSTFMLDYGEGMVTVEMDDWDREPEALKLLEGDNVTVIGKVDDNLFETTTIEASSVYVKNLNRYFYASAADEESAIAKLSTPLTASSVTVQGTVTSIDGRDFMMDAGLHDIRVATDMMSYNPLDDEGLQKIDVGDRVSVSGTVDYEFWDGRELTADVVITLDDRKNDR